MADEHDVLPRDRRDAFLGEFAARVNAELSSLAGEIPALRARLEATRGRQERAAAREDLSQRTARLAYLQALPAFTAADMCSEFPGPMAWHAAGVTFCLQSGAILSEPCRSWPVWNAKLARFAETMQQQRTTPGPAARFGAACGHRAGSSVDVIAQLTQVQAGHPGAQVRHGKRNPWEIWSTPAGETTREA